MLPGAIVDLHIEALVPDDFRVSFTLDSGEEIAICGRELYDPPEPFHDAFDLWSLLMLQATPLPLLQRELGLVDRDWEAVVAARRPQDYLQRLKAEDEETRRRLREEFQRHRGAG